MATAVVPNNNMYQPAMVTKPIPGETVVTETTITQTQNYASPVVNKGFDIFSTVFSLIAAFGYFCGAALLLTAMALVLRDVDYHYTSIGGLMIAGFSLWFLSALINWVPNFGGFARVGPGGTRSAYHIFNIFANALSWIGFALLIAGAACWLSAFGNPRYAGEILFVIGSSIWLAGMILRDLGLRYDAMQTYKNYPAANNVNAPAMDAEAKRGLGAHISSLWGNALATDLYLIAATLFVVGSALFIARGRNFDRDFNTAQTFQTAWATVWLVASGLVLFAAIAHCVARR